MKCLSLSQIFLKENCHKWKNQPGLLSYTWKDSHYRHSFLLSVWLNRLSSGKWLVSIEVPETAQQVLVRMKHFFDHYLRGKKDLLSVLISSHLTWDRRLEHRRGGSRRKACSLWSYWNKRREEWEIPGKGRKLLGCWRGRPELSASAFSLWSWKWEHLIEVSFVSHVESSWVGTCGEK